MTRLTSATVRPGLAVYAVMAALLGMSVFAGPSPVAAQDDRPKPPTVTDIQPVITPPSRRLVITGTHLGSTRVVTLAGISLPIVDATVRRLVVLAPATAIRGTITVSTEGGNTNGTAVIVVTPTVRVSPPVGTPGQVVRITGRGYVPGEPVEFNYDRTALIGTVADGSGRIESNVVVPDTASPGRHTFRSLGRFSGVPAEARHRIDVPWPQNGFETGGNRYNPHENQLTTRNVAGLRLDWIGSSVAPMGSSPIVVDNTVYAGDDAGALIRVGTRCATDGRSCSPRAHGLAGGAIRSTPAATGRSIIVGAEDGTLYAFPRNCARSKSPCGPRWIAQTEGPISTSPVIAGRRVYIGSDDGRVYSFDHDCTTGGRVCLPRWSGETGGPVRSSPVVHNGKVYVGSDDGNIYSFPADCPSDGSACQPDWIGQTGGSVRGSPVVADGIVYIGSGDASVYGFPVDCGRGSAICDPIWRGAADSSVRSGPVVARGKVIVGTASGAVMAFPIACRPPADSTGCEPTWTATTGGPVSATPTVAGEIVYVGSEDGFVYGYPLDCRPGQCQASWASGLGGPVVAAPTVTNGAIYATSEDGTVRRWSLP